MKAVFICQVKQMPTTSQSCWEHGTCPHTFLSAFLQGIRIFSEPESPMERMWTIPFFQSYGPTCVSSRHFQSVVTVAAPQLQMLVHSHTAMSHDLRGAALHKLPHIWAPALNHQLEGFFHTSSFPAGAALRRRGMAAWHQLTNFHQRSSAQNTSWTMTSALAVWMWKSIICFPALLTSYI